MSRFSTLRLACACVAVVLTATLARAQATSAPAASPEGSDSKTIELSPFTVTAADDNGYVANNSLSGSRLSSNLADIAASVSVFTEEFMSDIGATTVNDALGYANNVEFDFNDAGSAAAPNNNVLITNFQQYRVRGLESTRARNFYEWDVPGDVYNISRIEEDRGPNSILFGIAQAGGLINTYTKQPQLNRDINQFTLRTGSNESYRSTFDINRTLANHKLALRINAVYDRSNSFRNYMFDLDRRIDFAAKYAFNPNTSIRVEYEQGIVTGNIARPFNLTDASANWIAAGRPTLNVPIAGATRPAGTSRLGAATRVTYIGNTGQLLNMALQQTTTGSSTILMDPTMTDRSINVVGPIASRRVNFDVLSMFLEHRFNKDTFLELSFNRQYLKTDDHDATVSSSNLVGDPNNFLPDGSPNPFAGHLLLESSWFRAQKRSLDNAGRAVFTTRLDKGKWGDYRFVVMGEHHDTRERINQLGEVWEGAPFNAAPENGANLVYRRNYVTEGDWESYYVNSDLSNGPIVGMKDPITGKTLSSTWINRQTPTDTPSSLTTGLVGLEARYFAGRLVTTFGYRRDRIKSIDPVPTRDPVTNIIAVDYDNGLDIDFTGNTKTAGAVGHLTKNISLLANYSTNLGLPNPRNKVIGGIAPPPRTGVGQDVGLAFTALNGRIYARAVYFQTAGTDQAGARGVQGVGEATDRILETLVAANLITQAEADAPGRRTEGATVALYDVASQGYEFRIIANATRNLSLIANFSITTGAEANANLDVRAFLEDNLPFWQKYNQSLLTSSGMTIADEITAIIDNVATNSALEGLTKYGNRKYKANIFARYRFDSGFLKGFSCGAGYKYQSPIVIGVNGDNTLEYGNSYWLADAMLGYDMRWFSGKGKLRLQLNVTNLFDETDPLILRTQGVNIRRYKLMDPREWSLSANYSF